MIDNFRQALVAGVERLTAWADILDRINVFPIADGDTGRNLIISLSPLRLPEKNTHILARELLLAARGNSGNIAAAFFECFIQASSLDNLPEAIRLGRDRAWHAVSDPRPGTMLSFIDELATVFSDATVLTDIDRMTGVIAHLAAAVRATTDQEPQLRKAAVVDAGALGLFLFFEGFLHIFADGRIPLRPLTETFMNHLQIVPLHRDDPETGYCVDAVLKRGVITEETGQALVSLGESVIVNQNDAYTKIHFHTQDREEARQRLAGLGRIIGWADDDLHRQTSSFGNVYCEQGVHIMTDAAGSLSRQEAKDLGISLLDSYITIGDHCLPETCCRPDELYRAMRSGRRVTTAQASIFERHQIYAGIMSRHERVLYLCVGSAYTGNYSVVMEWKGKNDPEDRLVVIDTGAASGRLGVLVLAVAACARESEAGQVIDFARQAVARCEEYVFLDRLEYLAAGGRLSKTGAFFGDMLRMKPIITPAAAGARRVGVARNRKEQLGFAFDVLARVLYPESKALIMMEYSDNRSWLEEASFDVAKYYPEATVVVRPLSLTSGAHMGPGTWALAFLPDIGGFHTDRTESLREKNGQQR